LMHSFLILGRGGGGREKKRGKRSDIHEAENLLILCFWRKGGRKGARVPPIHLIYILIPESRGGGEEGGKEVEVFLFIIDLIV